MDENKNQQPVLPHIGPDELRVLTHAVPGQIFKPNTSLLADESGAVVAPGISDETDDPALESGEPRLQIKLVPDLAVQPHPSLFEDEKGAVTVPGTVEPSTAESPTASANVQSLDYGPAPLEFTPAEHPAAVTLSTTEGVHEQIDPATLGAPDNDVSYRSRRKRLNIGKMAVPIVAIALLIVGFGAISAYQAKKNSFLATSQNLQQSTIESLQQVEQSDQKITHVVKDELLVYGDVISQGNLRVTSNGYSLIIQPQNLESDQTLTLPNSSGTLCLDSNNCQYASIAQLQALQNQLGQIVIPAVPDVPASSLVNNQQGAVAIQGTSNQISVTTTKGKIKLATPQDLATISSPTFSSLILTGNLNMAGTLTLPLDCTGFTGGGALTTNAGGQVICSNDDSGGAGSFVDTSGGTAGTIPVFTDADTVADSIISQALGTVTIAGDLGASDLSASGAVTFSSLASGFLEVNGSGLVSVGTINLGIDTVGSYDPTADTIADDGTIALTTETAGNYVLSVTAGNGISIGGVAGEGWTPTVSVSLQPNKGLEVGGNGLSLIDCALDEVLKYNGSAQWICASDATGSGGAPNGAAYLTVGNDATLTGERAIAAGTNLTANDTGADGTYTISVVSNPTFSGLVTANGNLTVQTGDTFTFNGDAFTDLTGTGLTISGGALQATLGTSVDLSSEVTGTLPIGSGGTNAATAQGAINNISGLTTNGDLLYHDGANTTRLARGTNGQCLVANATTIAWTTCAGTGTTFFSLAGTSGTPQSINGGDTVTIAAGSNITTTAGATDTVTVDVVSNPTFSGLITANGSFTLQNGDTFTINGDGFTDLTGNGLQISTGVLTLLTQASKGLEVDGNGLSLIDCSSGQILKYNGSNQWACATDDNGSGGGFVTGSGSQNRLSKFDATGTNLVDSTITDDGTNVTTSVDLVVQGGSATLGTLTQAGSLLLHDGDGETITLNLPDISSSYALLFPSAVGSADQCLKDSDGAGTLIWADCLGGGGGGITSIDGQTGPSVSINNATGAGNVITIDNAAADGTTKGIAAFNSTNFSAASGVINTIQGISTSAAPQFAGLTLTGNLNIGTNSIVTGATTITSTELDVLDGGIAEGEVSGVITDVTAGNGLTGGGASGNATVNIASGNGGIVVNADDITLTVQASADALSSTTSSGSGLEVLSGGLTLLQGCADGQILKWNETSDTWGCSGDSDTTGIFTLAGTSGTPQTISNGDTLTIAAGSNIATTAGTTDTVTVDVVSNPTFSGLITANGGLTVETGDTFTFNGDAFTDLTGTGLTISGNALQATLGVDVDLASEITGVLPIANGGTNASTAQGAINNISGLTTNGDLLYHNGTNSTRLARGTDGQCLTSNATTIVWGACPGDGVGDSISVNGSAATDANFINTTASGTATAVTWSLNTGASPDEISISIGNASATEAGAVTTGTQTFAGDKTFTGNTAFDGNVTLGNASSDLTTSNSSIIASNSATATTGNTESTPQINVTTIVIDAAGSFANNDVIFIDNSGQDYYTRIVSGGGTTTLTVNPAVSYDADVTITKYNIQNIGATSSDYTSQTNRFFQGYFLGGVLSGSTTYGDGSITSGDYLSLQATSIGVSSSGGFVVQSTSDNDSAFVVLDSSEVPILQVSTSSGAVNVTGDLGVIGLASLNGSIDLGDASGDTITFNGRVDSNILPSANDTYDLGSDSNRWKDLYLGGDTLHIGTNTSDEGTVSYNTATNDLAVASTGDISLQSGANIDLSNANAATGSLLVLDSSSATPTGVNGGMYYDTTLNKFRCYENGVWANCIGGTPTTVVRKTANESTSSSTLQNDDHLKFSIGANETWGFTFYVQGDALTSGSGNNEFDFAVTAPSGATCSVGLVQNISNVGNQGCGVTFSSVDTDGTAKLIIISGTVANGSTAGDVTLQWADGGGGNAATVYAGSHLEATAIGSAGGGSGATLQSAYGAGNTITTTDGRDIDITLANTATDANFDIDIATGSTGEFRVKNNGADILQIGSAGQLQLDVQGSSGGILLGGDAQIYRSAADVLSMATDDDFRLANTDGDTFQIVTDSTNYTYALATSADSDTDYVFASQLAGDSDFRFNIRASGRLQWGDGTIVDTNLYRGAANLLWTDDSLRVAANLTVDGNITLGSDGADTMTVNAESVFASTANVSFAPQIETVSTSSATLNTINSSFVLLRCNRSSGTTTVVTLPETGARNGQILTVVVDGITSTAGQCIFTDSSGVQQVGETGQDENENEGACLDNFDSASFIYDSTNGTTQWVQTAFSQNSNGCPVGV